MSDNHLTAPTSFVDIDGTNFAYRRWGNAESGQPPLLFFQHFRGGMDHWDPIMTDGLAEGREVILYNYRGCASSTGTPRTRIEDYADDAASVIRALGLSTVDVVGFSLGGMVTQDFTRRHPDLVRKLMLLGTQPRGGNPDPNPKIFEVAPRPLPVVDDFLFLFFGPSETAKQAGRDFWERRHQRVDQDPPSSVELMQAEIEANTAFVTPLDPEQPFAHLSEITQPTLIVNGVNDVMIATINSWHMVQNIPNAQLIVYPGAGHGAQFQYPERFLSHAIQFLDE
ncbi:alpha/beta hydrolase [Neorhizobium sp. JUb45]|uniref:alpha/beta fold hydrolase n=1 Tax=Neorhizobium sp. JUb45 TaxID=2485113 RepID=UPI00104B2184|nr:alpha/beta hydrolase [Neorhizobium sp. JUb45]TCQ99125.1 pimeloyl-ACP methyl ester carboxylesterase [Neorhizobium sp. JUb45]